MDVMLTDISDVLTREVSKHGVIHGLDSFAGCTVKVLVLEPECPVISDENQRDFADPTEPVKPVDNYPASVPAPVRRAKSIAKPAANQMVFANKSDEPCPEGDDTASHIRSFVSS